MGHLGGTRSVRKLAAIIVLVLAGLGAMPALAQGFSFSAVAVEGNERIETGTILAYAGIPRGQAVSAAQVNDAGQNLRATGLFSSVEIVPQGSTLIIRVAEYPMINRVNFEGNSQIDDAELEALVRSLPRHSFNPATAEADTAAIAQAYASRGRLSATVAPRIIQLPDNRVNLVFEIMEGGVTEVERISFVGNEAFTDRRLRGVLDTKQAGLLHALVQRDTFNAAIVAADQQRLTDFYRSRGYVDFRVQNVDVALTRERDAYLVTYNVAEGNRWRIGRVTVGSEMSDAPASIFAGLPRLRTGAWYSPVNIDEDITRIENQALREGIPFVAVEPRITRNERDLTLDIEYVLVRAARRFVERIDIEGNNTTLDRVIRNEFTLVEGDPFNANAIRAAANRIRALGYFSSVDVQPRSGSAPDQVVIDVDVVEAPTGKFSFGGNYNTDAGFSLLLSFSEANFLGRGQRIATQLSWSQTQKILSFDFTEPNLLGRNLAGALSLSYKATDNASALYDTETFRFAPSLTFPISENGRLRVFVATQYTDITDVAGSDTPLDTSDDASAVIQQEAALGGLWSTSLGYTYSWDNRRSGLNENNGVNLRFEQEFGMGDIVFVKTTASAVAETQVLGDEVTLRAAFDAGYLAFSEGDSRVTDRFFLGSRYMRGFSPGGIGPRDAVTDDALGGNAFAVLRLETEFPLGLPTELGIHGGAFVDYGSVWDVGETYGATVLYDDYTPRATIGLSLFWDTPVGPLRFNFTEPLMAEEFDRPRSFELTVATQF